MLVVLRIQLKDNGNVESSFPCVTLALATDWPCCGKFCGESALSSFEFCTLTRSGFGTNTELGFIL